MGDLQLLKMGTGTSPALSPPRPPPGRCRSRTAARLAESLDARAFTHPHVQPCIASFYKQR